MEYQVRKAKENDRVKIAHTIVLSFEDDFAKLSKDIKRVAKVFENSIEIDRFFVAEQKGQIIGTAACTDREGRAVTINKNDCKRHLGLFRGFIAAKIFNNLFMKQLMYPITTGCIEFVGVLKQARGKGVAKKIIQRIIDSTKYSDFILDVEDTNLPAIKCYEKLGFYEIGRKPLKVKGANEKIYMKYRK